MFMIMIFLWPLFYISCVSAAISLSVSTTDQSPSTEFSYTSASSMRPSSTALVLAVPVILEPEPLNHSGAKFLGPLPQTLEALQFKTYTGQDFNVTGYSTHTQCWYPVSGNYGTLPRILLYFTLIFAVVARTHEWLIAGAMTAGLTYSGTAAIHACFLLWRGSAWGELDVLGLYATLSSSCLVVVPLLNWSSTLRNLGRIGLRREPTRAIILYWGFLVALGYLSIFIQFGGQGKTIEWGMYTWSGLENITCTPRGNLNLSAGQVPSWTDLILDQEFITENRCENPCSTSFSPNPPFRTDNDLQIPTKKEREFLDSWYYRIQFEHSPARHDVPHLLYFHYITFGVWSIVTVLAQGTYAASFGRRTPTEARYMLYKKLRPRLCGIKTSKSVAMFAYFWALAVLVLCPMVFVVNLVTIEMFLSNFPESDPLIHVGAWSSWAATGLVISAALISRYHEDAVKASQRFKTHATSRIRCCFEALRLCKAPYRQRNVYLGESKDLEESSPSSHNARSLMIYHLIKLITHQVLRKALEILTFLQKEYRMSVAFWRDPETTPLQTSGQEAQASVLNLPQNIHVNTNISSTSDPPISFSRSTTFNFSRASTSETLVQHPSKPEANDSKKGHDRFEIEEILSSSAGSLSTLTPPVPMVPERVLGKDRERKSSHRK